MRRKAIRGFSAGRTPDHIMETFGAMVHNARDVKKITIESLAADMGVAVATLLNIEAGKTNPGFYLTMKLKERLGLDLSRLGQEGYRVEKISRVKEKEAKLAERAELQERLRRLKIEIRSFG